MPVMMAALSLVSVEALGVDHRQEKVNFGTAAVVMICLRLYLLVGTLRTRAT